MNRANSGDTTADRILDFISKPESGGNYNAVFGRANSQHDLSQYTVEQIIEGEHFKDIGGRVRGQSATGRYQIIKKTLQGLVKSGAAELTDRFTPVTQDYLGLALLRQRGYSKWKSGEMSDRAFALNLAKEWASLPDPETGRSVYAGDGLNKSHVSVKQVLDLLAGK